MTRVRSPVRSARLLALVALCGLIPALGRAEEPQTAGPVPSSPDADQQPVGQNSGVFSDIGAYVTSPLRWSGLDWLTFGGAIGAVAIAHQFDSQVRQSFTHNSPYYLRPNASSFDLQDAAPAAALLVGTWGAAFLGGGPRGHDEAWAMLEAATFGAATAYTLKFAAGREGPDVTTDPNEWRRGGSSFPSLHSTIAFAVGTVMAESGNDEYRWLRRLLGYGVGVFTSYERLKHNQHWLSDTVAGAAIGAAAARFSMSRRYRQEHEEEDTSGGLSIVPMNGGLMVSYSKQL